MFPSKIWQRSAAGITFFIALYVFYWLVFIISPEAHAYWIGGGGVDLGAEDRAYEWIGFFGFFGAGIFSLMTLIYRKSMPGKVALLFLGFGLFYIVCAGEEISWGQRIFGWETPAGLKEANEQGETNFHNLKELPISPKDIVSWFIKLFGIGFPIIFYYVFKKRDHWLRRCVSPMSVVPLFVFVEIYNKLEDPIKPIMKEKFGLVARDLVHRQHEEIMEMYWGLCLLFAAIGLYLFWRGRATLESDPV